MCFLPRSRPCVRAAQCALRAIGRPGPRSARVSRRAVASLSPGGSAIHRAFLRFRGRRRRKRRQRPDRRPDLGWAGRPRPRAGEDPAAVALRNGQCRCRRGGRRIEARALCGRFPPRLWRRRSSTIPTLRSRRRSMRLARSSRAAPTSTPTRASTTPTLPGRRRSRRPSAGASPCSRRRTRAIARAAISAARPMTGSRRSSPTLASSRSPCRAIVRLPANADPEFFDLGGLRAFPHGPQGSPRLLRPLPDADAPQRGDAADLLPQRHLPFVAAGGRVLRHPRYRSRQVVCARPRRHRRKVRRPAAALLGERQHGPAIRRQARRASRC